VRSTLVLAYNTVRARRGAWLTMTLGFVALYYGLLLGVVTLRLGHWPNYVRVYDWPANVMTIIRSTPSVRDMLPIISDEWLFETGYINHAYGRGIAEWSLAIIPVKVAAVTLLGALAATALMLMRRARQSCPAPIRGGGMATMGIGTLCVGMTNISMSWIACCSTPSWVVGLSLIGIETSSAYALLPYGHALAAAGFAMLAATNYVLAHRCLPPPTRRRPTAPRRMAGAGFIEGRHHVPTRAGIGKH
jgi:ABC-type amino acid transport system permease subunit